MSVVKRNVVLILLSQGATWIVSILLLIVAPDKLGVELFGELSFALVYVSLFGLIATYGTSDYLTKTLARDPGSTGHYVFNTLALKLVASLTLSALAIGLAIALGYDRQRIALIATYCIGMVLNVLNNVLLGGLQALQRMGRPAFWNVIGLYTGAFVAVTVLFSGGGVVLYAMVFNVAAVIPLVGNSLALRGELRTSRGADPRVWRRVLSGGFPFFVMSGLLAIYGSVDIWMIEALAGTETVGWYTLAYRWVSMPAFFAASVATGLFPVLSAEGTSVSEAFLAMANRAIHVILLVAVPGAIGIGLVADNFISLLYGSDFQQSIPLMQLLSIHIPLVGLDIVLGMVAVASDRQRKWVMTSALAAVLNPLTNLIAIPYAMDAFDNGAIGAAFTTVLTEMIIMVGALLIRPKGVLDRRTCGVIIRIVIAGAAMIPLVRVLDSTSLYLQVAAGVLVYVTASFILKTISFNELRSLGSGFTNRRRIPDDADVAVRM